MVRNQQDIERQLKQFPQQRLSANSKERIHRQILNTDVDTSSRKRSHKRLNHVAIWVVSIAAVALFSLLGSTLILDKDPLTSSPAKERFSMERNEKNVPQTGRNQNDDKHNQTNNTVESNKEKEDGQTKAPSENNEATDQTDHASEKQADEQTIVDKSDTIIKAIANRDMQALAKEVHPEQGLLFSPYVYITDDAVVVDKADVPDMLGVNEKWTWGDYDGKGTPINLTPEQYFEDFMDLSPFLDEPDSILVDEQKKRGNTKNNIKDVFPDSKVVEYYDSGSQQYAGIDWSSINLVYETDAEGVWRLVAIVRDVWTV